MRRRYVWLALLVALVVSLIGCGRPAPASDPEDATSGTIAVPDTDDADQPTGPPDVTTPTPGAEALAADLQAAGSDRRLAAAWELTSRDDIPVARRVEFLADALAREIAVPDEGPAPAGSYLATPDVMRLHLTRVLSELGPEAVPALQAAATNSSGEAREHILIALVYAGDMSATEEVRTLVTAAASPVVRMDAARALGVAGDAGAVEQLTLGLRDPYVVTGEDHLGTFSLYPVREQAAAALRALGVDVVRGDDDLFRIGE